MLKNKVIALYSEKGGVGKTTILTTLTSKLVPNLNNSVLLDADASSQSLSDIIKFYNLKPKIVYKDNICTLPFLITIHNNTDYFFVDLAGREASSQEIEYFQYIDLLLIPIPPIYTNFSTPIHTVEKLLKHGFKAQKIIIFLNYMWSNEYVDKKLVENFKEGAEILYKKYRVNYFKNGISFGSGLNKNCDINKIGTNFNKDINMLSLFIKDLLLIK